MNKGVIYMGLAIIFFSVMSLAVKFMPTGFPVFELVLFRSIFASAIAYVTLKIKKIYPWGKRRDLLILRGLFGFVGLSLFFATVQNMPLATALVVQYLSPVFVAILGVFLLKERMKPMQWIWFALAFAGVIVIKGVDDRVSIFYLSLGILGALFSALAYTTVRYLKDTDNPYVVVFFFPLVTLPVSAIITFLPIPNFEGDWGMPFWEMPVGMEWFWLCVMGIFAQLGQIFMTQSLHLEKANIVSSMTYIGIVFGVCYGFFIFDETYEWNALLGIGMVLAGVLLNVFTKR